MSLGFSDLDKYQGWIYGIFEREDYLWYFLLGLILLSSFLITLRFSLYEPLGYGDEGFYLTRSENFGESFELSRTVFGETEIRGDRPLTREPMLFILLGFSYSIAGEVGMRMFMPIVSVISALLLFLLVRKMHSVKSGVFSVALYLSIPALITHTVFIYVELVALMFLIGSFYFFYSYLEEEKRFYLFSTGILFGFSVLTAQNVLVIPFVFLIVLYVYKKDLNKFFKDFSILIVITLFMMGPWIIHNYRAGNGLGFDSHRVLNPLGIDLREEGSYEEELPDIDVDLPVMTGHRGNLHEEGLFNYISFAYSVPIFLIGILGFIVYFFERKKKYLIPVLWVLISFFFVYLLIWDKDIGSVSRNTLFVVAPLSMAGGFALEKIYGKIGNLVDYIKGRKRIKDKLKILFKSIFVLSVFGLFLVGSYGHTESLRDLTPSEMVFEGCDWVRENTEEDSVVFYHWDHMIDYHCRRKSISNKYPGMDIALTHFDKSYDVVETIGVDYLIIRSSFIHEETTRDTYTIEFVEYLSSDDRFEEVYNYPEGCEVKDQETNCLAVFKVL